MAKCVVALSPWWGDQFRDAGVNTSIKVIFNPADLPDRTASYLSGSPSPRVLFVGKLEKRKGYTDLIKAAALILKDIPDADFVFVGHGELREARALSRELGIESSIHLMGWLGRNDLPKHYQSAAVSCLPSYDEGFPMSVLEAMSWGLPVVTSPVGGIPDIILHGVNGVLVRPGDIAGLASALREAIRLPQVDRDRMGSEARETVKGCCSPRRISNELDELYTAVLHRCVEDSPLPTSTVNAR
jgi:glycosyltransferase involved in cell wall biosynthesis